MNEIPKRSRIYGLIALGHILFSLTFPFVSVKIVVWLMKHNLYRKSIMALATPFFVVFLYYAYKRWRLIKHDRRLFMLIILSALIYLMIYETVPDLGEKLHVLNFSIMSLVIYKTCSPIMKLHWAIILAWVLTMAVGALDEYLQCFIPGRAGTLHDFWITVRSGLIGVVIAWIFDAYSRKGR